MHKHETLPHDRHCLINIFWLKINSTIKASIVNVMAFDIQICVWKSEGFCMCLISSNIELNMYSYLYTCDLLTTYRKLDVCLKNLDPNTLKHMMSISYIITKAKWSYNFHNDLSYLYLLTVWGKKLSGVDWIGLERSGVACLYCRIEL